jgi:ABC-type glycerol-3-phosphate transport system substrate-binding protein
LVIATSAAMLVSLSVLVSSGAANAASKKIGGSVSMWGEWTGTQETGFVKSLKPFETKTGIKVDFRSEGSNMDTVLDSAVAGGKPPQVAAVPDPGTLQSLAKSRKLTAVKSLVSSDLKNYSSAWNALASYKGVQYGVWIDDSSKNTVFYNPAVFKASGITTAPSTFEQMMTDAATVTAAGYTPFSYCSGSTGAGWAATDLFQNFFLKMNGAAAYNALATGKLSWSSPEVANTFTEYATFLGTKGANVGGLTNALGTDQNYPTCVNDVFPTSGAPTAAMVIEASFVSQSIPTTYKPSNASSCALTPTGGCYDVFAFPAQSGSKYVNNDQGAGDVAMVLKSTPQSRALIAYLASEQFEALWTKTGTPTPNKAVPASAFPNPVSASIAKALNGATGFVFSLDDEYGGTLEQDMWNNMLAWVGGNDTTAQFQSTMEGEVQSLLK